MGMYVDDCPICERFFIPLSEKISAFLINEHPVVGKMMLSAIVVVAAWGLCVLLVHFRNEIKKHGFKLWLANMFDDDGF